MRECPFCGFNEGWTETLYKNNETIYKIVCKVCGGSGPESKDIDLAEEKWDGILSSIEDEQKFNRVLNEDYIEEEAIGGVSAPFSTLNNTSGVGDVQPATIAATTGAQQYDSSAKGSGDSWGSKFKKIKRKKKKKKKIAKHKIISYKDFANQFN